MDFFLSTDIIKNMRSRDFFCNFFSQRAPFSQLGLSFFLFPGLMFVFLSPQEIPGVDWEKEIWKKRVIMDFEAGNFDKSHWRIRGMKNQALPDVMVTRNITAPLPGSRKALLFRFHKETNIPGEFVFPETIEFNEHVKELEFPVYSSKSAGRLSVILQSHDYENTKLFLTHLNFRGWKNVRLRVRDRLNQNDPVLNSKLVIRLVGIVYEPASETPYGSEILVGLDDISVTTREKYRTLSEPASLLE